MQERWEKVSLFQAAIDDSQLILMIMANVICGKVMKMSLGVWQIILSNMVGKLINQSQFQ